MWGKQGIWKETTSTSLSYGSYQSSSGSNSTFSIFFFYIYILILYNACFVPHKAWGSNLSCLAICSANKNSHFLPLWVANSIHPINLKYYGALEPPSGSRWKLQAKHFLQTAALDFLGITFYAAFRTHLCSTQTAKNNFILYVAIKYMYVNLCSIFFYNW